MNIIKKIRRILSLYERQRRLRKARKIYSQTNVSDDLSKTIVSDGANVELNSKSKELINRVRTNVETIVNQVQCDSEKLLNYVKQKNTHVYYIAGAKNLLKYFGEEEGFIPEKDGIEGLYLSVLTMNGAKFHSEDMFVFGKNKPEKYTVLYNFYKWFSKKSGLKGFEEKTQNLLKKYYKNSTKLNTSGLNLEQIVNLQEAISRENEAIDFSLTYEKEHEVSKKLSEKISKDNGANI